MSKARQLADIPQSQYAFRNKIINGNFDIWQRGTSTVLSGTSSVVSGYGTADRFYYSITGGSGANTTAGVNLSQQPFPLGQTLVPNNPVYFARLQATTLPTQSGTGSTIYSSHRIEYVKTLSGKTSTLSVWLKADTTRTGAITIRQSFGTGGSPSSNVLVFQTVVNLLSTWQKFTFSFIVPSVNGKTLGSSNNDYLSLDFISYKQDNSIFGDTLGQVGTWSTSAYLDIAQIQLEEGSVATPFEQRPIGLELSLCQRYFETGKEPLLYRSGLTGITSVYEEYGFKVTKRAAPALTLYSFKYYSNGIDTNFTPNSSSYTYGFRFTGASLTNWCGWNGAGTWYADAEL